MEIHKYVCQKCWVIFERYQGEPAQEQAVRCPRCGSEQVVLQASRDDARYFGCAFQCANASVDRCGVCPNREL